MGMRESTCSHREREVFVEGDCRRFLDCGKAVEEREDIGKWERRPV